MKLITFYYIANRKAPGFKEVRIADGLFTQDYPKQTKADIKFILAKKHYTPASRIKLTFHCETV